MQAINILKELKELQQLLNLKETKETLLSDVQKALNADYDKVFCKLEQFDSVMKKNYISSKTGEKPVYVAPKLRLPNFIKRAKDEYQAKLDKYNETYKQTEQEYYYCFKEKRAKLKNEDERDKTEYINQLREKQFKAEKELEYILNSLETTTIISKTYWKEIVVLKIISYFENNRVDTMKEAINMFHEEKRLEEEKELAQKHREKIEKMIQDLRNDMNKMITKIDDDLEDFECRLSMFESKIEDAYSKANEALETADSAYNKADEVYWNNRNNY